MVFLLDRLRPENLCQAFLTTFLEQFIAELVLSTLRLARRESEDRARQATAVCLTPAEHFLLHHLEETLSVDRVDVDFSLEATHFVGPGHGLTSQSVWPELHETFIDCVEEALVLNVNAFPD